jgi:folate-dependent phosphoribosylglycinamide formyltransferase PurN
MMQPSDSQEGQRLGPVADRPIRVVLFGGGPYLERGVREFLCRLEEASEIDFRGAFCQSQAESLAEIIRDLWHRRRWLAAPVMLVQLAGIVRRSLLAPGQEKALSRRLEALAERIHFVPDIHAPGVLEQVRSLEPDLGLVYGSPILKPVLFQIPRFGSLGIHHGKLPQYRGKKTTFWAMARGEPTAGVTIQKIGAGLDTGEIVAQGEVPTGGRSYRRVWEAVEELGLELYMTAVLETKRGEAICRPPGGEKGPLYRDPKLGDFLRFQWRRLSRRG